MRTVGAPALTQVGLVAFVAGLVLASHPRAQNGVALVGAGPIASNATAGDATHDYGFHTTPMDLASKGYVEHEYLVFP